MRNSLKEPLINYHPTCPAPVKEFNGNSPLAFQQYPQVNSTMSGGFPNPKQEENCCDSDLCRCIGSVLECSMMCLGFCFCVGG